MRKSITPLILIGSLCASILLTGSAGADQLSGANLINRLRHGGYVLLMRHASSPVAPPTGNMIDAANTDHERQLDAKGQATSRAMGEAIRSLHIPIGLILSSPTYRAFETLRLAGLAPRKTYPQLGDNGHSMQKIDETSQAQWLREKVSESPAPGTNTLIVTHMPNIKAAFGTEANNLTDGECLVFLPGKGRTEPVLVARIPIENWPALAKD